jgi:DNA-binding response OmpR family regulator
MLQPRNNARILVVDDQIEMVRLLADQLGDVGYAVELAGSGREALAALGERPVDLVITDLRMHDVDGFDILEAVREKEPFVPVIIMTAFGTSDIEAEAMRRGAYHYLPKPFQLKEVLAYVERALDTRRQVAESADAFLLGKNGRAAIAALRRRASQAGGAGPIPEDTEDRLERAIQLDLHLERLRGTPTSLRAFTFGLHARVELTLLRLVSAEIARLERAIQSDAVAFEQA